MASAPPTFTYVPAPHERALYGALFQAADTERTGSIGGARAVEFFTRSKVPVQQLKQIWAVADRPATNTLDPPKFAVAVRLIQLEQNGVKPTGPDLSAVGGSNLRPVFFEGMPGPTSSAAGGAGGGQPGPPQQQKQSQPPSPPRPPQYHLGSSSAASVGGASASVSGSVSGGGQLAVQDPYTLTPSEQSRYEQIFPDYCKQDPNFMTGAEAVALFNKSGLSQQTLAQIWNMVDVPVDNKLDKLEFAIAMHLIVCVSKKNLPLPPGLPISLKQLKSQHAAAAAPSPPQPSGGPPSPGRADAGGMMHPPPSASMSGSGGGFAPSNQAMATGGMNASSMSIGGTSGDGGGGGIPSPVAVRRAPAMSVASSTGMGHPSSLSGMPGPPPLQPAGGGGISISDAFEGLNPGGDTGSISSYRASTPVQQHTSAAESNEIPSPGAHHHQQQQPRAPAVMSATESEPAANPAPAPRTTQQLASSYNMGEASEELQKLRSVLQKLQAENISLKAKLGTMGDEEKDVQKELGATVSEISKLSSELTTLRAQVLASKSRLLEASAELNAAKEKKGVITDLITEASATKDAIDEAHAGIENAIEATRADPPPAATTEADLFGWGDDAPAPIPAPAPAAVEAPAPAPDTASHFSGAYSNESQSHFSQPPMEQQPQEQSAAPALSYAIPPAPAPAPGPGMYNGGGYTASGHNRNASAASGFGEVMGGTSGELDGMHSYDDLPVAPSMEEVELLKTKSKEADDVAKDAEESRRQLTAQLDELRRVADEAENKARAATAKPAKKKGLLGGRGQKKDAKEAQKLAAEARDKKDALLQVQSQVKDAEALAKATKDEAERLNKEAEEAQMKAASAASMNHQSAPTQTLAPPPPQATGPPMYGLSGTKPPPEQQPQAPQPVAAENGFGGPPYNGGFNANVMGSGGSEIPTPSGYDDPYSNPFE